MIGPLITNKKLYSVFERVWIEPEKALEDLEKAAPHKKTLTDNLADSKLLNLILNVLLQRFDDVDLAQEKLSAYYTSTGQHEKSALLTAWRMYGWTMFGNLTNADKLRQYFAETFSTDTTPLAYSCYYVFSCVYSEKNGYYEDFISLAKETEEHLDKYSIEPTWNIALLCMARLYRARTLSNYNRPEQAIAAMQQVQADINQYGLSNLLSEMMKYSYTMHYENMGQRTKSLTVLEDIVAMASKRKYNSIAKFGSIANLVNTYSLCNRQLAKTDAEFIANRNKQRKWIKHADELLKSSFTSSTTAFYYYTKAGFYWQENMLPQALQSVAKSILIFYRYGHVRFLAQAYTTAYRVYKTSAIASADYRMAYKAARCADQMRAMTDKYYKQVLERRIATMETQFKLKEKELNEALLQQQINAMNKEMQLTTLNLHEKIQVLDEIKTYVNSLKKKELETRQLINTIAKKIDSVKLTEEDKATLQQKMGEGTQYLSRILTEKYPLLTPLEIRMCGLFQTGMTNKELSKLYGQGEKSYEQHRYRIKKKLGLGSKDSLVKYLTTINMAGT